MSLPPRVVAIVMASGGSRRMGRDKLALRVGGRTVLQASVAPLLACERLAQVLLVTRPGGPTVVGTRQVINPDFAEGMAASMRAGILAAPADAWLLALGDLPQLAPTTVDALLDAFEADTHGIVVPTWRGRRGHPVGLTVRYREALLAVRGDLGAREVLRRHPEDVLEVPVDDPGICKDIDLPEDLG